MTIFQYFPGDKVKLESSLLITPVDIQDQPIKIPVNTEVVIETLYWDIGSGLVFYSAKAVSEESELIEAVSRIEFNDCDFLLSSLERNYADYKNFSIDEKEDTIIIRGDE